MLASKFWPSFAAAIKWSPVKCWQQTAPLRWIRETLKKLKKWHLFIVEVHLLANHRSARFCIDVEPVPERPNSIGTHACISCVVDELANLGFEIQIFYYRQNNLEYAKLAIRNWSIIKVNCLLLGHPLDFSKRKKVRALPNSSRPFVFQLN